MCGIAGIIGSPSIPIMEGMLNRINHRGPDSSGYQLFNNLAIGNTRLSIIDIEGGDQPICDYSKNSWVVLNGELYGYNDTRTSFLNEGYSFKTQTDTEILLPLYKKYGLDLFQHLNGMFAFCHYCQRKDQVIIARDHFGIKPVVYTVENNSLYFSSEIKSFYAVPSWKPHPDTQAWHNFLNIRFPHSPHTLFKDVRKIPPGCYMVLGYKRRKYDIPGSHQKIHTIEFGDWSGGIYKYHSLPNHSSKMKLDEALVKGRPIFQKAIDDQMIADVPVGVYLSGGIDSSTVTAFASHNGKNAINTFCLGFDEPTDENFDANIISHHFNTSHTDVILKENTLDYFNKAIFQMEEPKVNCLQGYLLSREAIKHQKVVLSGLGGDELFGGYDIYEIALIIDRLKSKLLKPCCKGFGQVVANILSASNSPYIDIFKRQASLLRNIHSPLDMYLLLRNGWDHDNTLVKQIYTPKMLSSGFEPVRNTYMKSFPENDSLAESFMRFEFTNKMVDDFLANDDRMSMAHGLEVRVPFLDRNIVDFAFSLPMESKIQLRKRKIFLKSLLKEVVPDEILHKKKHGFTFNPVLQAQKDLLPLAKRLLTRERVESSGIFNYSFIDKIIRTHPHNNLRWHYFLLWKVLGYHIWENTFIHNRSDL